MVVTEIFKSIQGESSWAGLPCVFVRLSGCNLRCAYCDTAYAFTGGTRMMVGEVLERAAAFGASLVEITGGEPLVQEETPALAAALIDRGHTVLVETNGTLPIDVLPPRAIKVMDLKCPGSGMCARNEWRNMDLLSLQDEVKFVLGDRRDYDWALEIVRKYELPARCKEVLLAPVFGVIDPRDIVQWMLQDGLDARFQLQMHKYIWPQGQKGV